MMPGSSWSRKGLAGFVAFISLIILGLILHFGPQYGVDTSLKQALVFAAAWVVLLICRYIPFIFQYMREKYHRWQEQKNSALPGGESRFSKTAPRNVTVASISEAMRTLYGRCWGRKVHILDFLYFLVEDTVKPFEKACEISKVGLGKFNKACEYFFGGI